MEDFKKCQKGHSYQGEECPYCCEDYGKTYSDPIELTKQYLDIQPELEAKIKAKMVEKFGTDDIGMGTCIFYWGFKQEILKKKYGIEWKSPGELNPNVIFD